jgi:hypothetical protein
MAKDLPQISMEELLDDYFPVYCYSGWIKIAVSGIETPITITLKGRNLQTKYKDQFKAVMCIKYYTGRPSQRIFHDPLIQDVTSSDTFFFSGGCMMNLHKRPNQDIHT